MRLRFSLSEVTKRELTKANTAKKESAVASFSELPNYSTPRTTTTVSRPKLPAFRANKVTFAEVDSAVADHARKVIAIKTSSKLTGKTHAQFPSSRSSTSNFQLQKAYASCLLSLLPSASCWVAACCGEYHGR